MSLELTVLVSVLLAVCFSEHVFGQAFRHLTKLRVLHLRRVAKMERLLAACIHLASHPAFAGEIGMQHKRARGRDDVGDFLHANLDRCAEIK